ncbi:hypothetical protein H0H93_002575, partial [Arthromyces matolae]
GYAENLQTHEAAIGYQPKEPLYVFSETMKGGGDVTALRPATLASVFSTVVRYCVIDTALYKDGKTPLRDAVVRPILADIKIPASILSKSVRLNFEHWHLISLAAHCSSLLTT